MNTLQCCDDPPENLTIWLVPSQVGYHSNSLFVDEIYTYISMRHFELAGQAT
jgi:hypothetical protein